MMREGSLFRGARYRSSCCADQTPAVIQSEIFSRQPWRGPRHSCVSGGADRLLTGRPGGCGLLHPERQGEGHRRFGARQGSRRCNPWCERILRRRMFGRTDAADSNGRDDHGIRHRAAGKSGYSPRDPSGTSVRRAVHRLLGRTIRVEANLVDQLFNSSEKRLAVCSCCWRTLARKTNRSR